MWRRLWAAPAALLALGALGASGAEGWLGGEAFAAMAERPNVELRSVRMAAPALAPGGPYESIERFCVTNAGNQPVTLQLRLTGVNDPLGLRAYLGLRVEGPGGATNVVLTEARLPALAEGTGLPESDDNGTSDLAGGAIRCFALAARLAPDAPNSVQGATFSYQLSVTALPAAMHGQ